MREASLPVVWSLPPSPVHSNHLPQPLGPEMPLPTKEKHVNKRTEAAARAMSPRVWGPQVWTFVAHGESPTAARARVQQESLEQALVGLTAADAVMFSDEAIERVAVALWNHDFPSHPINDVHELLEWTRERRLEQARLMVVALKGDA